MAEGFIGISTGDLERLRISHATFLEKQSASETSIAANAERRRQLELDRAAESERDEAWWHEQETTAFLRRMHAAQYMSTFLDLVGRATEIQEQAGLVAEFGSDFFAERRGRTSRSITIGQVGDVEQSVVVRTIHERTHTLLPWRRKPVLVQVVSTLTDHQQIPPFSMESGSHHLWLAPGDTFVHDTAPQEAVENNGRIIGQILSRAEQILDIAPEA